VESSFRHLPVTSLEDCTHNWEQLLTIIGELERRLARAEEQLRQPKK
jgi:hypothetical protein